MLKVYKDTKIYVHCPAGCVTGGAELLHQLVDVLRNNGLNAYIVYFGDEPHTLPSDYSCYNIELASEIEDLKQNIEVINEGRFYLIGKNHNIQKMLWWLSVDNFYICSRGYWSVIDLFKWDKSMAVRQVVKQFVSVFIKKYRVSRLSLLDLKKMKLVHAYQSEYAQNFLQNHGFGELVSLKDFVNEDHLNGFSRNNKENIVLYNPKKGIEFTRKIMSAATDINWVPLQNMTRLELTEVMKKAKLYIDFGYHPGKDRLPRECLMNGCCVITGKQGSAGFFEDVSVPDEYKFEDKDSSIADILKQVKYVLSNYDTAVDDFSYYRQKVKEEKPEFERDALRLFGKL